MMCSFMWSFFKGKKGGRIEKNEMPTLPAGAHYTVQKKEWMDHKIMREWIDAVLKPYVEQAPEGIVPVLFLDSYCAHMMEEIANLIQALSIEVFHIP